MKISLCVRVLQYPGKYFSIATKAVRKAEYYFCIFAKFGTHFIPYKWNIASKLFREISQKYDKTNKTYVFGLKTNAIDPKTNIYDTKTYIFGL